MSAILSRAFIALVLRLRHPARLAGALSLLLLVAADSHVGRAAGILPRGSLVLVGGGDITSAIAARYVALAGGKDRKYVYIPTAAEDADIDPAALEASFRAIFGVTHVVVLHTRDRR